MPWQPLRVRLDVYIVKAVYIVGGSGICHHDEGRKLYSPELIFLQNGPYQ
jgi:hypothetical protein